MNTEHFTPQQEAAHQRAYEDTLLDRYARGLSLSKIDKKDARRILRDRAAIAKAEGRS